MYAMEDPTEDRIAQAIRDNHIDKVRQILDTTTLDEECPWKTGIFSYAVRHQSSEAVNLFLGVTSWKYDMKFLSIQLVEACNNGDTETVRILLQHGADWCGVDEESTNWLCDVSERSPQILRMLLDHDCDGHTCDDQRASEMLHIACKIGAVDVVKRLLAAGVSVNHCRQRYPLTVTCESGYEELTCLLISHGADVNVKERDSVGPIHVAVEKGHENILKILLQNGADPNSFTLPCSGSGILSPLMQACRKRQIGMVKSLLQYGADVNFTNVNGNPPLHFAAQDGSDRLTCIRHGDGFDSDGFDGIQRNTSPEIVKILLEHGANPHVVNVFGSSPLEQCLSLCYRILRHSETLVPRIYSTDTFVTTSLLLRAAGFDDTRLDDASNMFNSIIKSFLKTTPGDFHIIFVNEYDFERFRRLVTIALQCGYRPNLTSCLPKSEGTKMNRQKADITDLLLNSHAYPPTLLDQCRKVIRRSVHPPLINNIWSDELRLPKLMRRYVMFEYY